MPLREPPGGYVFFGTAHGTLLFRKLTHALVGNVSLKYTTVAI